VPIDEILELQRQEMRAKQEAEERKKQAMLDQGLVYHAEGLAEDL
jgi:nucleosome binding factor SPN SPT16 subunit